MLLKIKRFYTIKQAGMEAMRRQLQIDEANLSDYHRPLKVIKERTHKTFFQKEADKHGFISAFIRSNLP